jgi:hypothetical protein
MIGSEIIYRIIRPAKVKEEATIIQKVKEHDIQSLTEDEKRKYRAMRIRMWIA